MAMTRAAPRIVMVLHTYMPESFGGAEQHTRRLAQALCRHGAQVTILAPRLRPGTPRSENDGPVRVIRFALSHAPNLGGRHFGSFLSWCASVMGWLWRNRKQFDIIHVVHGRLHAVPAVIAAWLLRTPVIIKPGRGGADLFDLTVVQRKRFVGPFFASLIRRRANAWIANSREIEADLLAAGIARERIFVIPNGIEIPDPDCLPRKSGSDIVFAYWGRLDPEKNLEQMIDVFARLPAAAPARLLIVGDGTGRGALERRIRDLGQQNRIMIAPAMDDVTPVLRQADFHISTSLSEGMSNALLEAMSFAVPPLVSRVSGVRELVTDGRSGLMFAPGDAAEFEAKLREALRMTPEQRHAMGLEAYNDVRMRCAMARVVEQHCELYRKLTAP